MSEPDVRGLQRFNPEQRLPVGFERLSEEEQLAVLQKMQEKEIDITADLQRAVAKSRVAEHDLHVFNEDLAQLDHDRKIYSSKISAETGSGKIDMQVRGGDTRFIVPILAIIGIILLALIALFALT